MEASRTLHPQDQIAHYRIVGPLGAGGMGEVYLAQDQTLERNVALKILPPELVRSEERVRRFVREAKSASFLNHPNIVTIYEIGQDEVHAPGSAPAASGSSAVHYISMELVSGETLSTKIHREKTDLRTLLGYLAQAAEGLAKAHAAGIVHRDLKPGNIMVSKDGFAKVLDFGLAKLTEKETSDPDATVGPTQAEEATGAGFVVGTVGYMAPEQVRGAAVDHRADIFSFGCILYEAATRKKPFTADSNVETMHKILHEKPAPIEELNRAVPSELRRLIRRCLAKSADQRLQSAKDLAIELREIVDEYDTLSAESGSGSSAAAAAAPARRRNPPAAMIAGGIVIVAMFVVGVLYVARRSGGPERPAAPPALRISAISNPGVVNGAAISPDGRYIAYAVTREGKRALWVRQVATGSDVQILPPQDFFVTGLTFSPDGNYLYYQSADPDRDGYNAIFEVPSLGGNPRKRAYDVDSRISFSPDGKQVCFRRGVPQKQEDHLVVLDLSSGKERVLAKATLPVTLAEPAWAPDGKRIAAIEARGGTALGQSVVTFRVEDGRREPVAKNAWVQLNGLAWMPDGKGLVVAGLDPATLKSGQLWMLSYPGASVSHITRDGNIYFGPTVSGDGTTLAAVRIRRESNLWVASATQTHATRQLTFSSGDEGSVGPFDAGPDSILIYDALRDGSAQIFSIAADGTGDHSLTAGQQAATDPVYRPEAGVIHQRFGDDFLFHIWRMDVNGENARTLTSGPGETISDVSLDGRLIVYYRSDTRDVLWKISSSGGEPVRVGASLGQSAQLSPDGRRIFHTAVTEVHGQGAFTPQIMSVDGTDPTTPALPPRAADVTWTPDGSGLTYLRGASAETARNVYLLRLDGSAPVELTRFTDGRMVQHRWSPDGKRILLLRRIGTLENLWIVNADGNHPVQLTDFKTGSMANMEWSRDGSRVLFTHGEFNQNVVLIRDFH
jgi:Tol biopolymer transport system component